VVHQFIILKKTFAYNLLDI